MIVNAGSYSVFFDNTMEELVRFVEENYPNSRRFVIADHNTFQNCIPVIDSILAKLKVEPQVFNIEPGEESKSLDSAYQLWENFTDLNISRKDVIINIGGGVVSDLGGFVAATYKRGVDVINVPTSLLAMADASIGGKVGVNFHQLKNQLGYFSNPKGVFINTEFLNTLPDQEFISGYAEMIKHALISDADAWERIKNQGAPTVDFVTEILPQSVEIKNHIVQQDPLDTGIRNVLNFGHTIGHAIETLYMDSDTEVKHGEAVAAGMIAAAYISHKQLGMPESDLNDITNTLNTVFDLEFVSWLLSENLALPLKHDKKGGGEQLNFVLLEKPGSVVFNQKVDMSLALKAFEYVQSIVEPSE